MRLLTSLSVIAAAMASSALVSAQADEVCPQRGGTLTYTFATDPVALSTIQTTSVPVAIVATKIYEGLLTYDGPQLDPAPGLATSWEVSDDSLTYTFHLRDDVTWHDGEPFTSADVKYSIEEATRPYHNRGKVFFGNVESIDTPDDTTVIFRLSQPIPYFMLAFHASNTPILPKHVLETVDTSSREAVLGSAITSAPIGTGPFKFVEWNRGEYVLLEKNEEYWQAGYPCLDRVVYRTLPDGAARAIALESGELDLAPMNSIPDAEIERLSQLDTITVTETGTEGLGTNMWLDVNLRDTPLSDVKVRQAISHALDRQQIIDVIWYGHGTPARGPLVSSNPFFDESLPAFEFDLERADALLDEAGYPRGDDGVRFTIEQYFLPYGEKYVRLGEYIRQQLGKIGIEVRTESLDIGGWLKAVFTDWDYQLTSTFTDNRNDPTIGTERLFTTDKIIKGATFRNSMGYSNPRVDELFEIGANSPNFETRKAAFDEMQQILHEELPVIFLVELANLSVYNAKVHGLETNGLSWYGGWEKVWKED
ncbi:MAG: ABC transporter substrate-binding protein [Acuticoccus sp.]